MDIHFQPLLKGGLLRRVSRYSQLRDNLSVNISCTEVLSKIGHIL